MLAWVLCPECSMVKIFNPPPALGPRVYTRVFYKTTLNCWAINRCKKNVWGGYCVIYSGKNLQTKIIANLQTYQGMCHCPPPRTTTAGGE